MSKSKPLILVVDDEKAIRNALKEILEFEGYDVLLGESGEQVETILGENDVDLILLDIKMQGMDGIETLEHIKKDGYEVPVIMISGHGTIQIAVDATKKGAFDFIQKPPDLNRLLISVRNALSQTDLKKENKQIKARLPKVPEILGSSEEILKVKKLIDKVAPTSSRVLITGENGTGKELVAKWVHQKSSRQNGPFIEVNCAAIPSELVESELFGYEKGAFTGADVQRIGKFELANHGTLFLDEIGDMPMNAQAKVLRALQEGVITKVGGNESIRVDVRVLSATNKDLREEIKEKQFREDLFHRISVIPIEVPSLSKRRKDIPLLAKAFLERLSNREISLASTSFSEEALDALAQREWSGNVRELQNTVERLAVLTQSDVISKEEVDLLGTPMTGDIDISKLVDEESSFQRFKEETERAFLTRQLEKHHWNITKTAESIGLQRSHIYNKIKKYNLER